MEGARPKPITRTLAHLALALVVLGALVPADLFTMPSPHLEVSARPTVGVLRDARVRLWRMCVRASPCATHARAHTHTHARTQTHTDELIHPPTNTHTPAHNERTHMHNPALGHTDSHITSHTHARARARA